MVKFCRVFMVASLLLSALLGAPKALAQVTTSLDSVLIFGATEVQSSVLLFYEYQGSLDSVSIVILGTVSDAGPPLDGIVTDDPGREITYILDGMSDPGEWLWDSQDGEYGGYGYEFQDGSFRLYSDNTPDRDFSNPATFQDGQLLLEGTLSEYVVYAGSDYPCPQCFPGHFGWVDFTGGDLFALVSQDGVGYRGWIEQTSLGEAPLDSLITPGRSFPTHGSMTLYVPVATVETTWGRIKARYR
jgi:hypothetical protein